MALTHEWFVRSLVLLGEEWASASRSVMPWWGDISAEAPSLPEASGSPFLTMTRRGPCACDPRALARWVGPRLARAITVRQQPLRNREWEMSFLIPREDLESRRLARAQSVMRAAGQAAGQWPGQMLRSLLTDPYFGLGFDGQPLFSERHPVDPLDLEGATYSNLLRMPLSDEAMRVATARFREHKTPEGRSLELRPTHLLVPPSLEDSAREILARRWPVCGAVLTWRPTLLVIPEFQERPDEWYLVDAGQVVRPFGLQIRQEPRLEQLFLAFVDEVPDEDLFGFGTFARGTATGTLPFLALKGGLS